MRCVGTGHHQTNDMASKGVHYGSRYEALISDLKQAGPTELLVISDFDQTLTKFVGRDGLPGCQCHEIILKYVDLSKRPCLEEHVT